jgi:predicted GIY-YIG superfamily endonuclease
MKQFGVYILQNSKNGYYYIGSTNDIERRLIQHNKGLVKATRNLRPLEIRCFIVCDNLTKAKQSEYRLKSYKRRDILEKVIIDKTFPWNYQRP